MKCFQNTAPKLDLATRLGLFLELPLGRDQVNWTRQVQRLRRLLTETNSATSASEIGMCARVCRAFAETLIAQDTKSLIAKSWRTHEANGARQGRGR